jgi:hypothetical protein
MAKKQITLAPTSTIFYDDQTKVLLTDHDVVEIDVPIGNQTQIALNSGHLLIVKEAAAEPTGNAEKANKQAGAGTGTGAEKPTETPPTEPHPGEPPPEPPPTETAPKGSAGKGK